MRTTKRHPEVTGIAVPKADFFNDVRDALHRYLMRTDSVYAKASRDGRARMERRKEYQQ
jgi:hypothetical protein